MTSRLPPAFSPEQAQGILGSLRRRAADPGHWSGMCLWFSGAELRPGLDLKLAESRYGMFLLRGSHAHKGGIAAVWSVIDGDRRADSHHVLDGIRYDCRSNSFVLTSSAQRTEIPVRGAVVSEFSPERACAQRTLEEYA